MSAEELSYQLPRRNGGSNLTWHDGRGQRTAHTRTVKLLQQPGTEGIQVKTEATALCSQVYYIHTIHQDIKHIHLICAHFCN